MTFLNPAWVQVTVMALAAWTIGYGLAGARWRFEHPALRTASFTSLGLAVISFAVFFLTRVHASSAAELNLFSKGLGVLAVPGFAALSWALFKPAKDRKPVTYLEGLLLFFFFAYTIWMIFCAALPASDRDEIIYHLEVPKQMLRAGGAVLFPDNIYAYFPQLGEMLFLLSGAAAGEWGARLTHVFSGLLLALAVYGFSRKYLSRVYSMLAAGFFLTVPSVMVIMPWAYVDLTYSLYAFLALAAVFEYFNGGQLGHAAARGAEQQPRAVGTGAWAVWAGIMAGCAAAVKFTGIQFILLLVCLIFLHHVISRRRGFPWAVLLMAAASLPFAAPYLWRNWYETGWPLFPFQTGGFELYGPFNWDADRAHLYLKWLSSYGTPLGQEAWWHTFLAPVLVFITARFNSYVFYEGVIGPVFLLTPFLLFRREKPAAVKWLAFFCLLFLYYWALTTKQVRFLIPVLPAAGFLLAYGLSTSRFKWLTHVLALALAASSCVIGVREVLRVYPFPYWLGLETRDQYLSRQVEGYRAYQSADKWVGPGGKLYLINMKNYVYFLHSPWRSDFIFERFQLDRFMEKNPSPAEVFEFFNSRGITHLLANESFIASERWGFPPSQQKIFREFLTGHAEPLMRDKTCALYRLKK